MTMVLAVGISIPLSMIVEHSSTLERCAVNSRITRSSSRSRIWPCATATRASGSSRMRRSRMRSMLSTSLCRKYTWPPRFSSRSTASRISPSDQAATKVLIASRFSGAAATTEKSRIPSSDIASVRGIGVAVRVRTSTSARSRFSASLWRTPKRCSSSMITSPSAENFMSLASSLCVPMTMSTSPEASCWTIWLASLELLKRDSSAIRTGQSAKRSEKVCKCCSASSVVGQSTATCLRSAMATNAARNATSVLPKPTSPHTSRSMAMPRGAPRVQGEQLGGRIAHLLRRARLGLVPFAASQLVQRRFLGLRAAVAADHAELRHRHIQLVAALVLEEEEFALAVFQLQIEQSLVAADAVLLVHHRVTDLQLRQVAQHPLDGSARLGFACAVANHSGIKLGLGDDRPAFGGHHEAASHGGDTKHKRPVSRLEFLKVPARAWLEAVLGKIGCHRLAPARRLRGHHHAQIRGIEEAFERGKRILRAAVHGDARQRRRDHAAVVRVLLLVVEIDARVLAQPQVEFFRRNEELRRRQQRPVGVAALQL